MSTAYRLLVGSVGDDIHSVGMALLTLAFRESGYSVRNLGIGNQLDDFFNVAQDYDAVFISCMNGHADLYLEEFPHKRAHYILAGGNSCMWYLGGNLSVNSSEENIVRKYRNMGFDYVAPKPVSWQDILRRLEADFSLNGIVKRPVNHRDEDAMPDIPDLALVNDEPLDDEAFARQRREVLLPGVPTDGGRSQLTALNGGRHDEAT